jgi:hypothetical protein
MGGQHLQVGIEQQEPLVNGHAVGFGFFLQFFVALALKLTGDLIKGKYGQGNHGQQGAAEKEQKKTACYFAAKKA